MILDVSLSTTSQYTDTERPNYSEENRWRDFFYRLGIFIFFCLLTIWVYTENFLIKQKINCFVLIFGGIAAKIAYDWIQSQIFISMTTALASIITTFDFNIGLLPTLLLNSLSSLNFIVRIIVLYYEEGWSQENFTADNLLKFYSIMSLIILIAFIAIKSLYLTYKNDM
jgi:hypothetical protein